MRIGSWDVSLAVGRPSTKPPNRGTDIWPLYGGRRVTKDNRPLPKPTPANLRRFAETPVMRRCINVIKNSVLDLEWVVEPRKGILLDDTTKREIEIVENILEEPNYDDSFHSFVGTWLEDLLTIGAGPIETKRNGDKDHPWWMWTVDGASIELYPGWDGSPSSPRYAQRVLGGVSLIPLKDEQIIYVRPNPRSHTPFGLAPAEVAFNTINAFFAAFEAARKRASNERPDILISLGENAKPEQVYDYRNYWIDEIEGTGAVPIIGGAVNPEILRLGQGTDEDLRLKYQEFLMRLVAISFDLSPGKLGMTKDINRSTKEGEMSEDETSAISPWSRLIGTELTRHLIRRRLGFRNIRLCAKNEDMADREAQSRILKNLWDAEFITADEAREELGRGPLPDGRGTLRKAELEAFVKRDQPTDTPDEDPLIDPTGGNEE